MKIINVKQLIGMVIGAIIVAIIGVSLLHSSLPAWFGMGGVAYLMALYLISPKITL
jgi:hypothetical protein